MHCRWAHQAVAKQLCWVRSSVIAWHAVVSVRILPEAGLVPQQSLLSSYFAVTLSSNPSSGFGCTDVLAGRKTVGRIVGDIRFAGHAPSQTFLRRYNGYVEQFGAHPS